MGVERGRVRSNVQLTTLRVGHSVVCCSFAAKGVPGAAVGATHGGRRRMRYGAVPRGGWGKKSGADDGIRTRDIHLGKVVL